MRRIKHITKNEQKQWYDRKTTKILIVVAMLLLVGLPSWFLFGHIIGKQYGFSSSKDAITNVMTNIEANDAYSLGKSFEISRKKPSENLNAIKTYAKSVENTYSISLASDYTTFDEHSIDADTMVDSLGFEPDEAKYTIVAVESKQTRDSYKCNGICLYEATTYRRNDKWYVCSFHEINYEILSMENVKIEGYLAGTKELGWLPLDESKWTIANSDNAIFDNAHTISCVSNDENDPSTIVLSALNSVTSYDDAINSITKEIETEPGLVNMQVFDDELNGMKCKRIVSTHITDGSSVSSYTWLIKNTMKDPYVHQITLTTTDATDVYPIIMAYVL